MSDQYLQLLTSSIQSLTSPLRASLLELHEAFQRVQDGTLNTELEDVSSQTFGITVVTLAGHVIGVGDHEQVFPLGTLSRVLVYGLALEDQGREAVRRHICMMPMTEERNTIRLDKRDLRSSNPLVSAGAIVATGLIQGKSLTERLQRILAMMHRYTGRNLQISVPALVSSKEQGTRERAIAYFLKQFNQLGAKLEDILDLYFQHSNILVSSRDLAMIGATLANGGINPVTGEQAIATDYVQDVMSVLLTCGMGEQSGEWTYRVGMPAQCSAQGGVLAMVPQKLGLGVFSPLMDESGRSVRGIQVCEALSKEKRLHLFDIYEKNKSMQEYIEQVEKITSVAAALDTSQAYDLKSLDEVAARPDELGQLARVFTDMVNTMKSREQELERLLDAFGRFVPHEFLSFLHRDSIVDVQLGDHVSKEMAVMFADIRSFTAISESMTPRETFDFVNTYLRHVSPEIRNHRGFVVKFMGDGMMAVFPEGADDAIAAGVAVFNRLNSFNEKLEANGQVPIQVGMGIHAGHMMVGVVGERDRLQGDTLSDTVNLAARLEGLTKYYGIAMAISGDLLQRLTHPDEYCFRFIDQATVSGRSTPITVYEVLNVEPEKAQSLKHDTEQVFNHGIDLYVKGDFTEAQQAFEQVLEMNPCDKTAQLYLERIDQLRVQGVPEQWDGVWKFRQK
ncbi:MAG: glutaminase [Leptolyngbyaceae bacterium]|nr:glutaminase [Leptolyngbyaceae bacterium]